MRTEPICKLNFLKCSQVTKNHLIYLLQNPSKTLVSGLIAKAKESFQPATPLIPLKPLLELFSTANPVFISLHKKQSNTGIITPQESCKEPKINRAPLPRFWGHSTLWPAPLFLYYFVLEEFSPGFLAFKINKICKTKVGYI